MSSPDVEKVVNAVLYEGYILYPYRASSKKNQIGRFTFGRVYPADYAAAQDGREPCAMQTEFLVRNESKDAVANLSVRFLQPLARDVTRLPKPARELNADVEKCGEIVATLAVGDRIFQTWQEATEREVTLPTLTLNEACELTHRFEFESSRAVEVINDDHGMVAGFFVRRQPALAGSVELAVELIEPEAVKIRVRILNQTSVPNELLENQEAVTLRTFASTHTILEATGGECISLLDPPAQYADAAKACQQIGTWPVLVGDEKKPARDLMLSSPIILYDYPQIAPESAGDLFDGAEIDEILTLRIQTMTDAEKIEMREVDEQARKILERTENMTGGDLLKMHGVMRSLRPMDENFFNPGTRLTTATVNGAPVKAGDRVRIRPKKRADVMDIALNGKIGIVEAVEEDVEGGVQLALVIEDDPGQDLGMMRQPGHRFFYSTDEVELLQEGE